MAIPLILNYYQKTETAKWLVIILGTLIISFLIILFGKDFHQDYCYLIVSILTIILLPKTSHRVIQLTLLFIFYIVTWWYTHNYPPLAEDSNGQLASVSTFIFTLIISTILLWRFINISKNIENKFTTSLSELYTKNELIEIDKFQIQQQNTSLKQVNKELDRFAYIASNDLQHPLNDILNHLNFINQKLKDDKNEEIREYLDFASSSAERMKNIVKDLLEFSKIEEGKIELVLTDLNLIISTVLLHIKESIDKRNAKIEIETLPTILAIPTQISLLFQNLIENGIKYNTSPSPKVNIRHTQSNDKHIFEIQDNGIGISEKNQARIFEIFHRLKEKSNEEGSGIGLAICKKIVEQHGGIINVKSQPQKGTIFIFELPVKTKAV